MNRADMQAVCESYLKTLDQYRQNEWAGSHSMLSRRALEGFVRWLYAEDYAREAQAAYREARRAQYEALRAEFEGEQP